jgi:apolipoprotein N-acyltransferase
MNFLYKYFLFVKSQNGYKKILLAVLFGALLTCAMPPVDLWPLAVIGLSGFFLMINDSSSLKDAFKTGWWFGFGHFVTGLYWISFALLVDFENFGWLMPFAILGIPAVVAVYTGVVALLTWHAWRYVYGWRRVIIFSCMWTIVEMLRGWLFTGFPWNLVASVWSVSDNMLQFASIAGAYGLGLVTVIAFTMPVLLANKADGNNLKKFLPFIVSSAILIAIFIWGGMRLASGKQEFVENVKLRIVQANIPQNMKWEDEWRYKTVAKYLEMSHSQGFEDITHIIWPETALPFVIGENSPLLDVIAQVVPKKGAVITGALRAEYTENGLLRNMWNSLIVVSDTGKIFAHYDKTHLVPFGEYVPFREILPLEKITHGSIDFARGDGAKTVMAPAFPLFGALVCYEVIFPGRVVQKENRPALLLNVTNDAWYGNSAGPYQHFQMARMRAVEEGLPLIRAANDGISGVIDAYGRIIAQTKLGAKAILDAKLPAHTELTIYARYGNVPMLLMIAILLLTSCKIYRISSD